MENELPPLRYIENPHSNPRFSLNAVREHRLRDWEWMARSTLRGYDSLADPTLLNLERCTLPGYEHIFLTGQFLSFLRPILTLANIMFETRPPNRKESHDIQTSLG